MNTSVKPAERVKALGDVSTSSELSLIYSIPQRTIQHAAKANAFVTRKSGNTVLIDVLTFKVWAEHWERAQ